MGFTYIRHSLSCEKVYAQIVLFYFYMDNLRIIDYAKHILNLYILIMNDAIDTHIFLLVSFLIQSIFFIFSLRVPPYLLLQVKSMYPL